ncbi:MAG TPA: amidase [Euzebyales bacterium]|nr:amidase [Euzebyales bacterium]
MDTFVEYEQHDAVGLAAAVRDGEVTPHELLDAAIARIERHNPVVNAVVTTAFDRARRAIDAGPPDGPLRGVPFLLKDLNHAWSGVRMTGGSRAMRSYIPAYSATLVQRLEAAGLVPLGMTNVPEFGITPVTEPDLHGICANPWDPTRSAGGSSGGSGAAVASRMVPAASASDGGGSIRIPASHCGLFGLKPTRARTPSGPVGADGLFGLSVSHALTRSVRDSAVLLDATHGPEQGDPYAAPSPERPFADEVGTDPGTLRIGVVDGGIFHDDIHPQCRAAVVSATDLVGDLGHEVVPLRLNIDRMATVEAMLVLLAASTAASLDDVARLNRQRAPRAAQYELTTWVLGLVGGRLTGRETAAALNHVRAVGRTVAAQLVDERIDAILTATLAEPPMRHRALDPTPAEERVLRALRRAPVRPALLAVFQQLAQRVLAAIPSLPLFNITGQPAMSVPLHWTPDGLPVGVQFAGRFGDEATLLRLAGQLEAARPWFDRRPPLATGARSPNRIA